MYRRRRQKIRQKENIDIQTGDEKGNLAVFLTDMTSLMLGEIL